jgi:nicotinamidase-related amidase
MFCEDTPWHVSWMREVLPRIDELARRYPEKTIFTRFVTPSRPEEMKGMWRAYCEKWWMMTRNHLNPILIDLVPSLKALVPPARIYDKMTYSPWITGELHDVLSSEGIETLVLSGGETDVCVLAAALGAVDLGYRVILLTDAVCSGADETHDASLDLLGDRFRSRLRSRPWRNFCAL